MPVHRPLRCLRVAMTVAAVAWSDAGGQSRIDTLAPAPLPSLEALVAALPGEPVALGALRRIAARDAIPARVAAAEQRRADGALLRAGVDMDPVLAVRSGVASDLYGGTPNRAVSSTVMASTGLRWGSTLSASYERFDGSGFDPVLQLTAPSTVAFSVSQPLFDGRRERPLGTRAATSERTAAEYQRERALQEVLTAVELQYWALAEAQVTEAVRARSVALAEQLLQRTASLATLDIVAAADLLAVRTGLARRRVALLEARQQRLERADALATLAYGARASEKLLNATAPIKAVDIDSIAPVAPSEGATVEALLAKALQRRPDTRAARERRAAARLRASAAQSALLPDVALEGGWAAVSVPGAAGGSGTLGPPGTARGWRAGLRIATPLFNRADRARALTALVDQDVEELRVTEAENAVRLDVRLAARAVALAQERLQAVDDAAVLATQQLEAERQRQSLGLSDTFRVMQLEEMVVEAPLDAVRARFDLRRALARVVLATGTGTNDR
jgi:outer membrane protein